MTTCEFRPANSDDAAFLVPLVAESSAGVWPAIWAALADKGESMASAGARYLTDTSNDLSIANTVLAMANELRVGAMISYQEPQHTAAPGRESVPLTNAASSTFHSPLPTALSNALQPYRELSDPNSLFISELCLLADARGQGIGTGLLKYAVESATEKGLPRVTLRVFSKNNRAVQLYERFGFRITGTRTVVAHKDITIGGSVLSMRHDV